MVHPNFEVNRPKAFETGLEKNQPEVIETVMVESVTGEVSDT